MQRLHPMWTVYSRSSILPINMDAKCVVEGRSMVNVISTAAELGYLNDAGEYPDRDWIR